MKEFKPVGKAKKKKQHYIPRCFLKNFTDTGVLCVLQRLPDRSIKLLKNMKPSGFGYEKYCYETANAEDGTSEDKLFPNENEDWLNTVENELFPRLDECINLIRSFCEGGTASEDECISIRNTVACVVSHIISRSPLIVRGARARRDDVLRAMKANGLDNSEALGKLYSKSTGCCLEDGVSLVPQAVAESLAVSFCIHPQTSNAGFLEHSEVTWLIDDLTNRSMLFLLAPKNCPFIGISLPVLECWEDDLNLPSLVYFPLCSNLSVLLCNKGELMVRGRHCGCEEVEKLNRVALQAPEWDVAFSGKEDVVVRLASQISLL